MRRYRPYHRSLRGRLCAGANAVSAPFAFEGLHQKRAVLRLHDRSPYHGCARHHRNPTLARSWLVNRFFTHNARDPACPLSCCSSLCDSLRHRCHIPQRHPTILEAYTPIERSRRNRSPCSIVPEGQRLGPDRSRSILWEQWARTRRTRTGISGVACPSRMRTRI